MSLYAVDDIGDAFDAMRAFLTPVDVRTWLKLALVAFFIAGPGGAPTGSSYSPPSGSGSGNLPGEIPPFEGLQDVLYLIAAIVVVIFVIALIFALIGSVMEFVFVESLRNEVVTIRRYWSRRWRQGLRLFGFRVIFGLLSLAAFGLVFAAFLLPLIGDFGVVSLIPIAIAIPAAILLGIFTGLVSIFTTHFVVPIMIAADCGVIAGWRRLWPTIRSQWKEYLAYAVLGFILSLAGGLFVGIAVMIAAVALLIPFGILGAIGFGLGTALGLVGWIVLGFVVVLFVLAVFVAAAIIQVPVQAFLRYYALFVLGDTNDEFDLIAERRAAVRE